MKEHWKVIAAWKFIRKPTTPIHLAWGCLAAFLIWAHSIALGGIIMIAFAIWEYWNDHELMTCQALCLKYGLELKYHQNTGYYLPEGAMDFWESSVTFSIGLFVLALLEKAGHVTMSWF